MKLVYKFLIFSLLAAWGSAALAQSKIQATIDTMLTKLASAKEDTDKLHACINLCGDYRRNDPASGIKYGRQAEYLGQKTGYKHMDYIYHNLGSCYAFINKLPEALECLLKAEKIARENGDANTIFFDNLTNSTGAVYLTLKNYPKALEYFLKSRQISGEKNDQEGIANAAGNLGNTYYRQHDYPKALQYFLESLKVSEQSGNSATMTIMIGDIGGVYYYQKNYLKAMEYYQRALALARGLGDKHSIGSQLGAIAEGYLVMATDTAFKVPPGLSRIQLAHKALNYLDTALSIYRQAHSLEYLSYYSNTQSEAYAFIGQYDKALQAYKDYARYNDSMFNREKNNAVTRLELKYEYDRRQDSLKHVSETRQLALQKEMQLSAMRYEFDRRQAAAKTQREMQLSKLRYEFQKKQMLAKTADERQQLIFREALKRQKIEAGYSQQQAAAKAAQQRRNLWFTLAGAVLIMSIVYTAFTLRNRSRRNLAVTRARIASDLHDDIGSTLNSISVYSEVAGNMLNSNNEKARGILEKMGSAARDMIDDMNDIVWSINPKNDDFDNVLQRMKYFAGELLAAKNMMLHFDADENIRRITLPMEKRRDFYLIYKEAVNNACKYSNAENVAISIAERYKNLVMTIADNGIGFNEVKSGPGGNGLKNMRVRAEAIGAKFEINSQPGQGTTVLLKMRI